MVSNFHAVPAEKIMILQIITLDLPPLCLFCIFPSMIPSQVTVILVLHLSLHDTFTGCSYSALELSFPIDGKHIIIMLCIVIRFFMNYLYLFIFLYQKKGRPWWNEEPPEIFTASDFNARYVIKIFLHASTLIM